MPLTSMWQFLLPESLLLEIFSYLDVTELGSVAQVCTLWRRVAYDEYLWHQIAKSRWKIAGPISPGRTTWRSEVKRLVHHVPCIQSEIFTDAHRDEVLDVSVSHNGEYFCTTSKDSYVILWKLDFPSTQVSKVDTKEMFSWSLTQYSKFNCTDNLLLVCGVFIPDNIHEYPDVSLGRGAIFTVPDLRAVQLVNLDPPTLFGAWLTSDVFIGGDLQGLHGAMKIRAFQTPNIDLEESFIYNPYPPADLFLFRGNNHHQMSILVADVPTLDTDMSLENRMYRCQSGVSASTVISETSEDRSECSSYPIADCSTEELHRDKEHHENLGSNDLENINDGILKRKRLDIKQGAYTSMIDFKKNDCDNRHLNESVKELGYNTRSIVKAVEGTLNNQWRATPDVISSSSDCSSGIVNPDKFSSYSSLIQQDMSTFSSGTEENADMSGCISEENVDISGCISDIGKESSDGIKCKKTKTDSSNNSAKNKVPKEKASGNSQILLSDKLNLSNSGTTTLSLESPTNTSAISSSNSSRTASQSSRALQNGYSNSDNEQHTKCSNSDGSRSVSQNTYTGSEMSVDKFYNADLQSNFSSSTLLEADSDIEDNRVLPKYQFNDPVWSCSNRYCDFKKYVCFVSGADDAVLVKEVTDEKLETVYEELHRCDSRAWETHRDAGQYDTKDNYFYIKDCYITGMCLSHDHRYIYFNYREWDKEEGELDNETEADDPMRDVSDRSFCENIKVGVIDLQTMTRLTDITYEGHIGFSSYPAWYICLAASQDYLGSGSEDATAYLWDRHYRVNIAKLHHTELVVNGIAFSPVDQECCVSVCDDKSIIVWRSKNRMTKLSSVSRPLEKSVKSKKSL